MNIDWETRRGKTKTRKREEETKELGVTLIERKRGTREKNKRS